MISHCNIGINDIEKAEAFYNAVLAHFNATQMFKKGRTIFYSFGENSARLSINMPFDGKPATVGNGSMVAFSASGKEQVDAVYNTAMEMGGSSEGEPGMREAFNVYAAYFRDPDGNKFGIFSSPE